MIDTNKVLIQTGVSIDEYWRKVPINNLLEKMGNKMSATTKLYLYFLNNKDGFYCEKSYETIAKDLKLTARSVANAFKNLCDIGYITKEAGIYVFHATAK